MKLTKRLALDGIRKNKEVYLPYILIYGFMVFSFTSILLLMNADTLKDFYAMSSLSLIHISEPTRLLRSSRMPSSA